MAVQALTNTATQQSTSTTPTGTRGATSATSISPDAFLRILITELQNQDPLNPQKPEDFLTQLAQLTSVQQLTNISSSIDGLSKASQEGSIAQWLPTVGKKVDVQGNALSTGDQVTLQPQGNYSQIILTLSDANTGNLNQVTFKPGDSLTYTHKGTNNVTFGISATQNGTPVSCGMEVSRIVQGVQTSNSGIQIVLGDGTTVPVTAVTKITQ
jgi:flagellar basal-body rod modification protein FlgD